MLKGVPEIRIVTFAKTSVLGEGQEGIICRGGRRMLAGIFIELTNYIAVVVDATRSLINIVQYSYHYSEISLQDLSTRSIYKIYRIYKILSTRTHLQSQYVSTYNPTTNPPPSLSISAVCTYAHTHTHIKPPPILFLLAQLWLSAFVGGHFFIGTYCIVML